MRVPFRVVAAGAIACSSLLIAGPVSATAGAAAERGAPPTASEQVRLLQSLWRTVLTEPVATNPYTGGERCLRHAGVLSPFSPDGADLSCTVAHGTGVFVTAFTSECSTVEAEPYYAPYPRGDGGPLRRCAVAADAGLRLPQVSVDGRSVRPNERVTPVLGVTLPTDPIIGSPGQKASSAAHGWVVGPLQLAPGAHTIRIMVTGIDVFGTHFTIDNTTTVTVRP